ncbi:hypothetical protein ACPPVO_20970 [Dactylosporangium sp. McL0621]|uniref:hypothetical protein n=1 Tax=Dactylosporangium sp. McL0621 TaxID=3415678 RepID=UPI003CF4BA9D
MPYRAFLSPAARLLLDEAADARPLWIVLQDGAATRSHSALDHALRLVVDPGPPAGVVPGRVNGEIRDGRRVLRTADRDVPAAVVGVLLAARDHTGVVPRLSCPWPERHLVAELAGLANPAVLSVPRLRLMLRRAEPDAARRPVVHVW